MYICAWISLILLVIAAVATFIAMISSNIKRKRITSLISFIGNSIVIVVILHYAFNLF